MNDTIIRRKLRERYGRELEGNIHITGSLFHYLEMPFRKKYGEDWEYEKLRLERGDIGEEYDEILDLKWKILNQIDFNNHAASIPFSVVSKKVASQDSIRKEELRKVINLSLEEKEKRYRGEDELFMGEFLGTTSADLEKKESVIEELLTTVVLVCTLIDNDGNKVNPYNPCSSINCDFDNIKTDVYIQEGDNKRFFTIVGKFDIPLDTKQYEEPQSPYDFDFGDYAYFDADLHFAGNVFDIQEVQNQFNKVYSGLLKERVVDMLLPTPSYNRNVRLSLRSDCSSEVRFDMEKYFGGDIIIISDFVYRNNLELMPLRATKDNFLNLFYSLMAPEVRTSIRNDQNKIKIHALVNLTFLFIVDSEYESITMDYDFILT